MMKRFKHITVQSLPDPSIKCVTVLLLFVHRFYPYHNLLGDKLNNYTLSCLFHVLFEVPVLSTKMIAYFLQVNLKFYHRDSLQALVAITHSFNFRMR